MDILVVPIKRISDKHYNSFNFYENINKLRSISIQLCTRNNPY